MNWDDIIAKELIKNAIESKLEHMTYTSLYDYYINNFYMSLKDIQREYKNIKDIIIKTEKDYYNNSIKLCVKIYFFSNCDEYSLMEYDIREYDIRDKYYY